MRIILENLLESQMRRSEALAPVRQEARTHSPSEAQAGSVERADQPDVSLRDFHVTDA